MLVDPLIIPLEKVLAKKATTLRTQSIAIKDGNGRLNIVWWGILLRFLIKEFESDDEYGMDINFLECHLSARMDEIQEGIIYSSFSQIFFCFWISVNGKLHVQ